MWNFDISEAPRDGSPVILAFGGKTFKSHWNKNKVDPDNWSGMKHDQVPDAWMAWPTAPDMARKRALDELGALDGALLDLPIIEDCGSGD